MQVYITRNNQIYIIAFPLHNLSSISKGLENEFNT